MSQAEIARVLGLSPASMTKMKRAGCPMGSVEEVRAWRARNVGPYIKPGATSYAPPPRPYAAPAPAPARPAHQRPLAELLQAEPLSDPADVIEALVRELVMLPRVLLQPLIEAVDIAIQYRLQAGLDATTLRPVLCELLQHQPDDERRMSVAAWNVATGMGEAE